MSTLECRACGRTYRPGPGEPWRCSCGSALDFAERPLPTGDPDVDPLDGLRAFEAFLPVAPAVTLGEGFTPLAAAPSWDARFKLDYVLPSGSFKDRGAAVMLSRAVELGVDRVLEDSSGNAGAAVAQYAARAGIPAKIYVPAGAKPAKLRAIERAGATLVQVGGARQNATDACVEAVEAGEGWYASHAWNPAFYAGTATFAYELAAQFDWAVPDAVVLPIGHGTLFLGAYRGFRALFDAGWTDAVPRLLGVQAAGAAPLADDLHGATDAGPTEENALAAGIRIREPARRSQLSGAVEATDGDVIAVGREATEAALDALHRAGFYCEATSAVATAGLAAYRESGTLSGDADVVVALTGSGLKG